MGYQQNKPICTDDICGKDRNCQCVEDVCTRDLRNVLCKLIGEDLFIEIGVSNTIGTVLDVDCGIVKINDLLNNSNRVISLCDIQLFACADQFFETEESSSCFRLSKDCNLKNDKCKCQCVEELCTRELRRELCKLSNTGTLVTLVLESGFLIGTVDRVDCGYIIFQIDTGSGGSIPSVVPICQVESVICGNIFDQTQSGSDLVLTPDDCNVGPCDCQCIEAPCTRDIREQLADCPSGKRLLVETQNLSYVGTLRTVECGFIILDDVILPFIADTVGPVLISICEIRSAFAINTNDTLSTPAANVRSKSTQLARGNFVKMDEVRRRGS